MEACCLLRIQVNDRDSVDTHIFRRKPLPWSRHVKRLHPGKEIQLETEHKSLVPVNLDLHLVTYFLCIP